MSSNAKTFPILVKKRFTYLLEEYGFWIESETNSGVILSEWTIIWYSPLLKLRFCQDKGQVFLDIGSASWQKEWLDINDVTAFISHGVDNYEWEYPLPQGMINDESYDQILSFLEGISRKYINQLIELFTSMNYDMKIKARLEKFIKRRANQRWDQLIGGRGGV